MSDSLSWSLPLGRWFGAQVRVHSLFLGAGVLAWYLATSTVQGAPNTATGGSVALGLAILLVSVWLHEAAHIWAAARAGGSGETLTIGPLTGQSYPDVPREAQAGLITALAGPLVNLAVLLLALPLLAAGRVGIAALLNPLVPPALVADDWWENSLRLTFWINGMLFVVNLLPALPFDGARVLRALLAPALDDRTAGLVAARISKVVAVGLCLLAWMLSDQWSTGLLPQWVPLVLLALFVFFHARHESTRLESPEWNEDVLSYDFSQGYTSLERGHEPQSPVGGSFRRWLEGRRELRRRRRVWQEQEEERLVDEILERLHAGGMECLSAKERAILERVSARYRGRQRN